MSGKGSAPRPLSVDDETYSANWAATFGKSADGERAKPEGSPQEDSKDGQAPDFRNPGTV